MINSRIAGVLVFLLLTIIGQAYYNIFQTTYRGRGYPYNTSMVTPAHRWDDFKISYWHGKLIWSGGNPYTDTDLGSLKRPSKVVGADATLPGLGTAVFHRAIYFPFANVIAAALASVSYPIARFVFLCFFVFGAILALVLTIVKFVPKERVRVLLFLLPILLVAHPFVMTLDCGNYEGFVFVLVWFYSLLYSSKKCLAGLLLAVAISVKPQVGIFVVLPALDGDFSAVLKTIISAGIISSLSMVVLPGPVLDSFLGLLTGLKWFHNVQMPFDYTVRFNHTLFNLLKGLNFQTGTLLKIHAISSVSLLISTLVGGYSLARLWQNRKDVPFESKLLILTTIMLVFPPISFDYTLLYLFPVFFVLAASHMYANNADWKFALKFFCIALVLAPKEIFVGTELFPFGPAYIVNAAVLLFLLWSTISEIRHVRSAIRN